jgi:protein-disulfide isomerase
MAGLLALAACSREEAETTEPEPTAAKPIPAVITRETRTLEPPAEQLAAGVPHLRFDVELGDAPRRGADDALVTLVMFSDFECPFCRKGLGIVKQLETEYPGQLRFVYKAFPIDRHPNAVSAALVAHSAFAQDEDKFWRFHDLLYSGKPLGPPVIAGYAEQVGLDMPRVMREVDDLTYGPVLRGDLRQAKRLDVRSTPTFFVNGRPLPGAQDLEVFREMIDQEIALAQKWRSEGVTDVYEHATHLAYSRIEYEGNNDLDPDSVFPVPIDESPVRGNATAPLTVVVFSDFGCPYCARGHATIERLRERYGDRMRVVYKHLPMQGPAAISAALGAWAAGKQGKFWEFHDQMAERGPRFTTDDLELTAMRLELDLEQWWADLKGPEAEAAITADVKLGSALGVDGTPTYFVNGRPLGGARPELEFRLLFSEELIRAQEALDGGASPEGLYAELAGLESVD